MYTGKEVLIGSLLGSRAIYMLDEIRCISKVLNRPCWPIKWTPMNIQLEEILALYLESGGQGSPEIRRKIVRRIWKGRCWLESRGERTAELTLGYPRLCGLNVGQRYCLILWKVGRTPLDWSWAINGYVDEEHSVLLLDSSLFSPLKRWGPSLRSWTGWYLPKERPQLTREGQRLKEARDHTTLEPAPALVLGWWTGFRRYSQRQDKAQGHKWALFWGHLSGWQAFTSLLWLGVLVHLWKLWALLHVLQGYFN